MTVTPCSQVPAPIECETAVRRLWDYVDGRLPPPTRDEVRAHLATCVLCAPRFTFARAMKEALGALGASDALAQLDREGRTALDARIREALRRAHPGTPNGNEA